MSVPYARMAAAAGPPAELMPRAHLPTPPAKLAPDVWCLPSSCAIVFLGSVLMTQAQIRVARRGAFCGYLLKAL